MTINCWGAVDTKLIWSFAPIAIRDDLKKNDQTFPFLGPDHQIKKEIRDIKTYISYIFEFLDLSLPWPCAGDAYAVVIPPWH